MATDRQLQKVVARCVSIMVFYHNDEKTPKARATMVAEVQAVVGFTRELGLGGKEVDECIVSPVEAELYPSRPEFEDCSRCSGLLH